MENFNKKADEYLSFLENDQVTVGVSLFLILYATLIAPKLPVDMLSIMGHWFTQIVLLFLIIYIARKNMIIALIATFAVIVTIMLLNNKTEKKEGFCGCNKNKLNQINEDDEYMMYGTREHMHNVVDEMNETNENTETCGISDIDEIGEHDEIVGILDADISNIDMTVMSVNHAVNGGAITSIGGPKMQPNQEPEYPTHMGHKLVSEIGDKMEQRVESKIGSKMGSKIGSKSAGSSEPDYPTHQVYNVPSGVIQHHMDNDTSGSSLDEVSLDEASLDDASSMGSDYAKANKQ